MRAADVVPNWRASGSTRIRRRDFTGVFYVVAINIVSPSLAAQCAYSLVGFFKLASTTDRLQAPRPSAAWWEAEVARRAGRRGGNITSHWVTMRSAAPASPGVTHFGRRLLNRGHDLPDFC